MQNVTLIGIDLGKNSFHIPCQEKHGNPLLRKKFSRTQLTQSLPACWRPNWGTGKTMPAAGILRHQQD